jgi:hypothetical protein
MVKVLLASVVPVVAAPLDTISVIAFISIRICYLLEVFGLEVVSWILSPPLTSRSLLLLKSVLFTSCQLEITLL